MSDLMNPLDAILAQAAQLPNSKQVEKYAQRINPSARRATNARVLLLDISNSMGEWLANGDRKINILRKALNRPLQADELAYVFSSTCEQIPSLQAIPEPFGGTALHLAIETIRAVKPRQTLVVSDGQPDDEKQALAAAKKLSGVINTLYIGSDDDVEAIAFMRKLARLGCGQSVTCDLQKTPDLLAEAINLLLPAKP